MKKAVSLTYPEYADAPYISAIARGRQAERLIALARENEVPIVRDDALANVLSLRRAGDLIPEETYVVLAKIFAFIVKMERDNEDS